MLARIQIKCLHSVVPAKEHHEYGGAPLNPCSQRTRTQGFPHKNKVLSRFTAFDAVGGSLATPSLLQSLQAGHLCELVQFYILGSKLCIAHSEISSSRTAVAFRRKTVNDSARSTMSTYGRIAS